MLKGNILLIHQSESNWGVDLSHVKCEHNTSFLSFLHIPDVHQPYMHLYVSIVKCLVQATVLSYLDQPSLLLPPIHSRYNSLRDFLSLFILKNCKPTEKLQEQSNKHLSTLSLDLPIAIFCHICVITFNICLIIITIIICILFLLIHLRVHWRHHGPSLLNISACIL